jgi:hypothetical protein
MTKKPQHLYDMRDPDDIRRLAVERIDNRLGAGYAETHSDLLDAIMKTMALDMQEPGTSQDGMSAFFNPGGGRLYGIGTFAKTMYETDRALENYILETFNPTGRPQ